MAGVFDDFMKGGDAAQGYSDRTQRLQDMANKQQLLEYQLQQEAQQEAARQQQIARQNASQTLNELNADSADPIWWKNANQDTISNHLANINVQRQFLGMDSLQAIPDPRPNALTADLFQAQKWMQQAGQLKDVMRPVVKNYLTNRYGSDFLTSQNLGVLNTAVASGHPSAQPQQPAANPSLAVSGSHAPADAVTLPDRAAAFGLTDPGAPQLQPNGDQMIGASTIPGQPVLGSYTSGQAVAQPSAGGLADLQPGGPYSGYGGVSAPNPGDAASIGHVGDSGPAITAGPPQPTYGAPPPLPTDAYTPAASSDATTPATASMPLPVVSTAPPITTANYGDSLDQLLNQYATPNLSLGDMKTISAGLKDVSMAPMLMKAYPDEVHQVGQALIDEDGKPLVDDSIFASNPVLYASKVSDALTTLAQKYDYKQNAALTAQSYNMAKDILSRPNPDMSAVERYKVVANATFPTAQSGNQDLDKETWLSSVKSIGPMTGFQAGNLDMAHKRLAIAQQTADANTAYKIAMTKVIPENADSNRMRATAGAVNAYVNSPANHNLNDIKTASGHLEKLNTDALGYKMMLGTPKQNPDWHQGSPKSVPQFIPRDDADKANIQGAINQNLILQEGAKARIQQDQQALSNLPSMPGVSGIPGSGRAAYGNGGAVNYYAAIHNLIGNDPAKAQLVHNARSKGISDQTIYAQLGGR